MKNIHESISNLLSQKLEKYKKKNLSSETCIQIYQEIFDTFVGVFQESNIKISNESMNILSQMYYDSIKINDSQDLDPNIFDKRASLKNIETKELAMMATMLNGTLYSSFMIHEIKRRS